MVAASQVVSSTCRVVRHILYHPHRSDRACTQ
jgi:hypothetical protein